MVIIIISIIICYYYYYYLLLLLKTFVKRKIRIDTPNALSQQLKVYSGQKNELAKTILAV